ALEFSTLATDVQGLYDFNGIRQVIAPETFADIVELDEFAYEVRFYLRENMSQDVDGDYVASGEPFVTWRVENPDADEEIFNRLTVTEIRGGESYPNEYVWDEAESAWTLNRGGGLRIDEKTDTDGGPGLRVETHVIKDSGGVVASTVETTYQEFAWGEEAVEVVNDPAGEALTRVTAYYTDPAEVGAYGEIKSVVRADGSWAAYVYDELGRVVEEKRPWLTSDLDGPARVSRYDYAPVDPDDSQELRDSQTPRTVTETIDGLVTGKAFTV
ncbi:MAG: hypothetical protein GY851_06815, partial [bacterium]|nr:hypothetical protein [bacterium]